MAPPEWSRATAQGAARAKTHWPGYPFHGRLDAGYNTRIDTVASRRPVLSISLAVSTVRRALGILIGLSVLVSASVKAIAVGTGRDFVFGIIPAFDPSGSRNLIAWESSMLLGVCACLAAAVAGTRGMLDDASARGWWTLAAVMGLFSLVSMTGVAALLLGGVLPPYLAPWVLAAAGALVAALALVAAQRAASPPVPPSVWLALLLFVLSRRTLGQPGAFPAFMDLISRWVEWSAMAVFVVACIKTLAQHAPLVAVDLRPQEGWPARFRRGASAIDLLVCPSAVMRWSAVAIVLLVAASLLSAWLASALSPRAELWYRFLFMDFEGNLPTWFSAILLLVAGLVAAVVSAAERTRGGQAWWYWALMAVGFVTFSADEAASLHERLVVPLRALVRGSPWLRYPIVIPGTVAVVTAVVVFGGFVRRLPAGTQRAIVGGGGVFLFGVLVLETIGGWFDPVLHGDNVPYVLLATVEEVCELTGVTIVLVGLLRYAERHVGVINVHLVDDLLAGEPLDARLASVPRGQSAPGAGPKV